MKKQFLLLFLSSLISFSHANSLDDWSNEDLCRWMDSASIPEPISEEVDIREIICYDDFEVNELTVQAPYENKNGTVFPSPSPSVVPKVKPDSGFHFSFNYKITL